MRNSESNMEHYRGVIEGILNEADKACLAVVDGVPKRCLDVDECDGCDLYPCTENKKMKWLMAYHKPKTELTAREFVFLDCLDENGYIARDESGCLCWYEDKPEKDPIDTTWKRNCGSSYVCINEKLFLFITWEDEEPWSVEELRKLKVQE